MTDNAIQPLLALLAEGRHLSHDQATRAFQVIMNGGATPAQMAAFLTALRMKGETVEEIAAGAEVLRLKAAKFSAPAEAMDTCGTGGDGRGTLNISTATALVLAACGVPVVKHGNRAVSSASGSADILEALGAKIDVPPPLMERALQETNFCFLFAPRYHAATRHVAPVRQELRFRTVFNLLGPLSNPAQPSRQLLGVFAPEWVEKMAQVLIALGTARAWVVHGHSGIDELSLTGPSTVAEVTDGKMRLLQISPEDAGLRPSPLSALAGGSPAENAEKLTSLLISEKSPYRDAVLLNAAAGLVIADKAPDLRTGAAQAAETIDSGAALGVLRRFIGITQEHLATAKNG